MILSTGKLEDYEEQFLPQGLEQDLLMIRPESNLKPEVSYKVVCMVFLVFLPYFPFLQVPRNMCCSPSWCTVSAL